MKFVADLHIHSKYARATSPRMNVDILDQWATIKGIKVMGTGDFTHPEYFKELKQKLESAEPGLFKLKNSTTGTRFLLTSEISCIYSKNGRVRKIHIIVFAPSFEIVEKINIQLGLIGNLKSDGRPILGLDAKELVKIILNISSDCFIVPAHCWTPWFSLFGSKSGFDSLEECFEEYSKHIYALETGLSADPEMFWRVPDGRKLTLLSNSDAHSPEKIGREANVFDTELSYSGIVEAIKSKDPKKFLYTIEFFPQEGKYHHDGHRKCGVSLSPKQTKECGGICPVCGKPVVIGVLNRVEELADRESGFVPDNAIPYKSLIPLQEIIGESIGAGVNTLGVKKQYDKLIQSFDNEFSVLLDIEKNELEKASLLEIAEGIIRVRKGDVFIKPGYDGEYGEIGIFSELEGKDPIKQKPLF